MYYYFSLNGLFYDQMVPDVKKKKDFGNPLPPHPPPPSAVSSKLFRHFSISHNILLRSSSRYAARVKRMGEQKGYVNEGVKTIGTWNQGGGWRK